MPQSGISIFEAAILGVVEGLTEFLPVSSTGHLILAGDALGLDLNDPAVAAFMVVIQAGALVAVVGQYWPSVLSMIRGALGGDPAGRRLCMLLTVAFLPAGAAGFLLGDWVQEKLFTRVSVALALGLGGAAMIVIDRWRRGRAGAPAETARHPDAPPAWTALGWRAALGIGLAQTLALWPGTSRSMVTILGGMVAGLPPRAAAEFSFLLALPTLGAATLYSLWKEGDNILQSAGAAGLGVGFAVSCAVAWLAMKSLLAWLNRRGLAPFGWYRIALAALIFALW